MKNIELTYLFYTLQTNLLNPPERSLFHSQVAVGNTAVF